MFRKILIANRGEIACRVARTCRRMGIAVSGVHSSADADGLHVRTIGESVEIGGPAASDSYLRIDRVLAAAQRTGADAIHPGFGFLAENAAFARAVEAAGLVFIGPTPDTIERLGDKASAKEEAEAAGVPTVPGSTAPSHDVDAIEAVVRNLGLPVMLKAAAGGGGKGMRAVTQFERLRDAIESAMREGTSAFGDARLIVEKLVERGRHIEVQIAGDGHGDVVHLYERECTLQRRHQKLIEEAPAFNLAGALRERMLADAVRLGQRLRYRGVGTVEFIVSGDEYYFLEVNPRLQVEHPVTEEITGIDLVEWMIRIAGGERIPLPQGDIRTRGHAIEARLCAEDPSENFLPSTGTLALLQFPIGGVRLETGVERGSTVTPYYDSMIAKLIAHADARDDAIARLVRSLEETAIAGVSTNRSLLRKLLLRPETRAATFQTRLIDDKLEEFGRDEAPGRARALALAGCFWMLRQRQTSDGPWCGLALTGWHLRAGGEGLSPMPVLRLQGDGRTSSLRFAPLRPDGAMLVDVDGELALVRLVAHGDNAFTADVGGMRETVRIAMQGDTIYVHERRGATAFVIVPPLLSNGSTSARTGELRAPMMGTILQVRVAVGDAVKAGDVAAVLESMKMEMRIAVPVDGIVTALHCRPGETVERNAVVAVIEGTP